MFGQVQEEVIKRERAQGKEGFTMKKFSEKQRIAAGVKQHGFDMLDTIPDIPNKRSARPWYYVTRGLNAEMLVGFDAYGNPVWYPHDMRGDTMPHMYNCLRRAQEAATRLGGAVKSCHYDRHSRRWQPYAVG
jgi:hypothetical protein